MLGFWFEERFLPSAEISHIVSAVSLPLSSPDGVIKIEPLFSLRLMLPPDVVVRPREYRRRIK